MDDGDAMNGGGRRPLLERIELPALRRVDDALVPVLQRGARRVASGVGRPFRQIARWEDRSWFRPIARNRGALAFVAVVVATTASWVHLERFPEVRAETHAERQAVQPAGGPGADEPAIDQGAVAVGPPLDVVVDDYIADRHEVLAGLNTAADVHTMAVVSFDAYLTAEEVLAALPPGADVILAQYRIPAEGEPPLETEVAGGDLEGAVRRAVEEALAPLREEEREVELLLESGTVQDEAYVEDYERRLSELRAVRNVVEAGAPVIFAVVVEAPTGALQELADTEHVRLVDPAPPGTDRDRVRWFGVRPEDTGRATYGRTS